MKKIIAILVTLSMLTMLAAAVAETPSKQDPTDTIAITGEGIVEIVWTTEEEVGQDEPTNPVNEIKESRSQGSALDVLPQELRDLLPENFTVVNEIGAMKLEGDLSKLDEIGDLTVAIKFDTPYTPDSVVYLAVGIPGEETEWVLFEGKANADSNVEVTFDHNTLVKIGAKAFAVMAISER